MKKLRDKRFAIVDIETTGLSPDIHEIIEFAVVYSNGEALSFKITPDHPETAHPRALAINGYTPEKWVNAWSGGEAARKIEEALDGCVVGGYNVSFDVSFIRKLLAKYGIEPNFGYHLVDVAALAYEHLVPIGLESLSLKNVSIFLDIEPEPDIHEALNGAMSCFRVYKKLVRAGWIQRQWWRLVRKNLAGLRAPTVG